MDDITIDGTKMVAGDLAKALNEYPMCDITVEEGCVLILSHVGSVIKRIKIEEA